MYSWAKSPVQHIFLSPIDFKTHLICNLGFFSSDFSSHMWYYVCYISLLFNYLNISFVVM